MPLANSLNYDVKVGMACAGCDPASNFENMPWGYDGAKEFLAWIANQDDQVWGFVLRKDGKQGYIKVMQNGQNWSPGANLPCGCQGNNDYDMYFKKQNGFNKGSFIPLQLSIPDNYNTAPIDRAGWNLPQGGSRIRWDVAVQNDADCALACDTYPECTGFYTGNQDRYGYKTCVLTRDAPNWGRWNVATFSGIKKSPPPKAQYHGNPVLHSDATNAGGWDWMNHPSGNNCGGFNGSDGNKGSDLKFGTNYNGNCPSRFLTLYCPRIGRIASGTYANPDGSLCDSSGPGCIGGDKANNLRTMCDYSSIDMNQFIKAGHFDEDKGNLYLKKSSWNAAKTDYCSSSQQNLSSPQCQPWLDNPDSGTSFNAIQLALCAPDPNWPNNKICVNAVNQVFKTGVNADKSTANRMVQAACDANPSLKACACYNAVKNGVPGCLNQPTIPGCDSIAAKVGAYKSLGAQFLSTKLVPFCATDQCLSAKTGSSGDYISQPAADQPTLCQDKINACFQQVTVGQISGGTLNAGCTINDLAPSTSTPSTTTPPTSTPSTTTPPTSTPSTTTPPTSKPSTTTPPTSKPSTTKPSTTTPVIIGISVGGFILCIICIVLLYMFRKH